MDQDGALLELIRQPANEMNFLPEGWHLSVSLEGEKGSYKVKGLFAGKGIYPLYGSMGKKRARNFVELPLDTIDIDPETGKFIKVDKNVMKDFWYKYYKALTYDVDDSITFLLVPGEMGQKQGWINDDNKLGLFYLQKMIRMPNERGVSSYVGVPLAKFKIKPQENESTTRSLKRFVSGRSRISAEIDLKKSIEKSADIQSLYFITKTTIDEREGLYQIELPITYEEAVDGTKQATIGTYFYVKRFNPDGTTDPSWGAKYSVQTGDGMSKFDLSDISINFQGIEALEDILPESFKGKTFSISGKMDLQWIVEPVKTGPKNKIVPFPKDQTRTVEFDETDIGDIAKDESFLLVNFYASDWSRHAVPYALKVNQNESAITFLKDVFERLNNKRTEFGLVSDKIFNVNAPSTTYDMYTPWPDFMGSIIMLLIWSIFFLMQQR